MEGEGERERREQEGLPVVGILPRRASECPNRSSPVPRRAFCTIIEEGKKRKVRERGWGGRSQLRKIKRLGVGGRREEGRRGRLAISKVKIRCQRETKEKENKERIPMINLSSRKADDNLRKV